MELKKKHLDTAAQCEAGGIVFVPMVCEAHGGSWEAGAMTVWRKVAKASAMVSGELPSTQFEHMLQSLSVTLHRSNARAILIRTTHLVGAP